MSTLQTTILKHPDSASNNIQFDSNGRVGIGGVASPSRALHVGSSFIRVDDGFGLDSSGSTEKVVLDNGFIAFSTNSFEKVRVDVAGRLLAGTSSAITGSDSEVRDFQFVNNIDNAQQGLAVYSFSASNNAPRIELGSSPNAALGTFTDPSQTNFLLGRINFAGSDGTKFVSGARIEARSTGVASTNDLPGFLTFLTTADGASSPTERARISSAGYFMASGDIADSDRYNNTYHAFTSGKSSSVVLAIENSSGTPFGSILDFSDASPDNNSSYFIKCQDSTTNRCFIWSDGDLDNHDNSYGGISDQKLKQDIIDAGSQWDDLKDLRVRKFKFKSDVEAYGDEAKTLIGLVAQEAELVSPGLVKDNPDLDNENNDLGTVTKTVRYSVLYMKAIKALQEAMERIETLEQRLSDAGIA